MDVNCPHTWIVSKRRITTCIQEKTRQPAAYPRGLDRQVPETHETLEAVTELYCVVCEKRRSLVEDDRG